MQDSYVWVDRRWQKTLWLDVFRVRLCGWLPFDLAAKAMANGLLTQLKSVEGSRLELTQEAHHLTDITVGIGNSPENCVMLANVLIAKGFASNWLSDTSKAGCLFLKEEQVFPKDFSNSIFREMHTLKRL